MSQDSRSRGLLFFTSPFNLPEPHPRQSFYEPHLQRHCPQTLRSLRERAPRCRGMARRLASGHAAGCPLRIRRNGNQPRNAVHHPRAAGRIGGIKPPDWQRPITDLRGCCEVEHRSTGTEGSIRLNFELLFRKCLVCPIHREKPRTEISGTTWLGITAYVFSASLELCHWTSRLRRPISG